jgi:poly-beta-1,6-N-acetyl-D-glucosamine synthase
MPPTSVVAWVVAVCFSYLALTYLSYALLIVTSVAERRLRTSTRRLGDDDLVRESTLTIPVTIVAPLYNEAPIAAASVASFVAVDYPEYDVVVVNDGSTDATLERLIEAFALQPVQHFYRKLFTSKPIRTIYRSATHPNLLVIDKENGGKADSLNCGLNFARYRYVCGVDGDTILARRSLLDGMRLVLTDPGRVIGVTGHIAINGKPEASLNADGVPSRLDRRPLLAFQHLDYLRSFFNNRLGWTRLNMMLCAVGAFQIWRRDVLEEVNGFSTEFTCEDIELTFRVHEKFLREQRDYEIHCLPDNVGTTEGPDTVRKLVSQRERWQRVINETVWHYRGMWFRKRYGSVGLIGAPFYLFTEVLAPAFELLAIATFAVAVALGVFDPAVFVLMLVAIAFLTGALTACAILLDDLQSRTYRTRDLVRMLLLAPLDLVLYRPVIVWARLKGTWRFLRHDKAWHKFERNVRAPA